MTKLPPTLKLWLVYLSIPLWIDHGETLPTRPKLDSIETAAFLLKCIAADLPTPCPMALAGLLAHPPRRPHHPRHSIQFNLPLRNEASYEKSSDYPIPARASRPHGSCLFYSRPHPIQPMHN